VLAAEERFESLALRPCAKVAAAAAAASAAGESSTGPRRVQMREGR
jgi:hypothetical protein